MIGTARQGDSRFARRTTRIAAWLGALGAIALALAPGVAADPWPQDGQGPENRRFLSPGGPPRSHAVQPIKVWTRALDGDVTGTPVLSTTVAPPPNQPNEVAGGMYVGTWTGIVYRLGLKDGHTTRATHVGGPVPGALLLANGNLFAVTSTQGSPRLVAMDPVTLDVKWVTLLDNQSVADAWGSPNYDAALNLVYIGIGASLAERQAQNAPSTMRGAVVAVDATSGAVVWKRYLTELPYNGASVAGSPMIHEGRVYVGTGQAYAPPIPPANTTDAVVALNAASGAIEGVYQAHPDDVSNNGIQAFDPSKKFGFVSAPMAFPLRVGTEIKTYVGAGSRDGSYYAFDPVPNPDGTLAKKWQTTVGAGSAAGGIITGSAYDNRRVIGQSSLPSLFWGLTPSTGAIAWAFPRPDAIEYGAPAISNSVVWSTDTAGFLDSHDATTGRLLGRTPLGAPSSGGAAVGSGAVFVGIGTGRGTGGGIAVYK